MNNSDLRDHIVKKRDLKEVIAAALIAIAMTGVAGVVGAELQSLRQSQPDCVEDENWAVVPYDTPGAVEDMHGVSRMCVHYEDLVDMGIEVAIQNGVLQYVAGR